MPIELTDHQLAHLVELVCDRINQWRDSTPLQKEEQEQLDELLSMEKILEDELDYRADRCTS